MFKKIRKNPFKNSADFSLKTRQSLPEVLALFIRSLVKYSEETSKSLGEISSKIFVRNQIQLVLFTGFIVIAHWQLVIILVIGAYFSIFIGVNLVLRNMWILLLKVAVLHWNEVNAMKCYYNSVKREKTPETLRKFIVQQLRKRECNRLRNQQRQPGQQRGDEEAAYGGGEDDLENIDQNLLHVIRDEHMDAFISRIRDPIALTIIPVDPYGVEEVDTLKHFFLLAHDAHHILGRSRGPILWNGFRQKLKWAKQLNEVLYGTPINAMNLQEHQRDIDIALQIYTFEMQNRVGVGLHGYMNSD